MQPRASALRWLEQHPIAGANDLDRATALAQADALGDEHRLAQSVQVSVVQDLGMKCTRFAVARDGGGAAATGSR